MSHRPTIYGTRHAVSAGHYLAAAAGFSILEAGGNAIDAGCAAGIALGVLQPDLVNVAGVAPIMLRLADGTVESIAGLGWWPKRLPADLFMREHGGKDPRRRAAHRDPGRARCVDHRAAPPRHDALRRCRRAGDPVRRRGVLGLSAAGGLDRLARARVSPLAVQHGDLPAGRTRAEIGRKIRAGRPGAHVAIHGRSGPRRRGRPAGGAARRARRVLSRRHRARDRAVPAAGGRLSGDGRSRRVPFPDRTGGAPALARPRADHLRAVVPGAGAAAGAGAGGAGRHRRAGAQLGRPICTASSSA